MKVKHLKWKKEKDAYISITPLGYKFEIFEHITQLGKHEWNLFVDNGLYVYETFEEAKKGAEHEWKTFVKAFEKDTKEIRKELNQNEKILSKCLERTES